MLPDSDKLKLLFTRDVDFAFRCDGRRELSYIAQEWISLLSIESFAVICLFAVDFETLVREKLLRQKAN
jgi:hypothetical protein